MIATFLKRQSCLLILVTAICCFGASAGAQTLLNLNFGPAGSPPLKAGLAATGLKTNDVWNYYARTEGTPTLSGLRLADGTTSEVSVTVGNSHGAGLWGTADAMYQTFVYGTGDAPLTVTLNGLPAGTYAVYLYGHGNTAEQNSRFATAGQEAKSTATADGWNSFAWAEGYQYVVFRSVTAGPGGTLTVEVTKESSLFSFLNGLQLVRQLPADDGISTAWRLEHFGENHAWDARAAALADADGDGFNNYLEYRNGTLPLVKASQPTKPLTVSTYAGNGTDGSSNGYRTNAQFFNFSPLRLDATGRLWVGDQTRIRIIGLDGQVTTYTGTNAGGLVEGPVAEARFAQIDAIVFDSAGNVFVNDRDNHRIRKITPEGIVSTFAGSTQGFAEGTGANAKFNQPIEMSIDGADNLFVADYGNHRIRKITPAGEVTTVAGTGAAGSDDGPLTTATLAGPTGVVVGPDGSLYVAGGGSGKIRKISNGTVSTLVSGLGFLVHINVDGAGAVYSGVAPARSLDKYTPDGVLAWRFAPEAGYLDGAAVSARFGGPLGYPLPLPDGNLMVADGDGRRLRLLTMGAVPMMSIFPASKAYTNTIAVVVTNAPLGSTVRYTLDGSEPTASSAVLSAPLNLTQTVTLKARAYVNANPVSDLLSETYTAGYVYAVNDLITAAWREQYFGPGYLLDPRVAADADPDGDGLSNYQEFRAGTHPLDAESIPIAPVSVGTYAGTGVEGMKDAFRTEATFGVFSPLVRDPQGRVWVGDPTAIRIIGLDGVVTTYAGTNIADTVNGPRLEARFKHIGGFAFDTSGNAFVVDRFSHNIRKITPDGVVSTFAGSTPGLAEGTGTAAQFNEPIAITIDAANVLYVADLNNHRIRKITPGGVVTTLVGSTSGAVEGLVANAKFNKPTGITLAADGNFYVSDWGNGRIRKISGGAVSTIVSGLGAVDQISSDAQGDLYVVDNGKRQLSKFRPSGSLVWRLAPGSGFEDGPVETARFGSAFGAALAMPDGSILVSDAYNCRVRSLTQAPTTGLTFTPGSTVFTNTLSVTIGGPLTNGVTIRHTTNGVDPTAASTSYTGPIALSTSVTLKVRLYVGSYPVTAVFAREYTKLVDFQDGIANNWRLEHFGAEYASNPNAAADADPDGDGYTNFQEHGAGTNPNDANSYARVPNSVSTFAGTGATGGMNGFRTEATFGYFSPLRYDAAGRLWIGDASCIRIIDTAGNVTTYAGTNEAGLVEGPVATARFAQIDAIVFDSHGNAFVNDRFNHRIRKITPEGVVSTFAGSTAGFKDDTGAAAQFHSPIGLTIDPDDNLYVADFENLRVRKITPAGVVTTFAGGERGGQDGPVATATFNSPTSVGWAPDGSLYVGDWSNGKVRKIKAGVVSTVVSGLSYVDQAVNADGTGNVLVVANGGPTLAKYSPAGKLLWSINGGTGFEDGPIASARFGNNFGMPLELADGSVLVTDPANYRIRKITMGAGAGLTIDPASTVFTNTITVRVGNRLPSPAVVRYTLDGTVPTASSPVFNAANGLTLSSSATITVRGFVNAYPVSFPASATFTKAFIYAVNDGISASWRQQYFGNGYLSDPRVAATADPDNDGLNNYQEFKAGSDPLAPDYTAKKPVSVSTFAGRGTTGDAGGPRTNAQFLYFSAQRYDAKGRLWLGDASRIRIIETNGNVFTYAGTNVPGLAEGPVATAQFSQIDAIVFDSLGNTFVTDRFNHRIRKITADGVVSTFAGSTAGLKNDTGEAAQFNQPIGLTIDAADNLYVADFENLVVRKITPAGVVTTFAGSTRGGNDGDIATATFNSPTSVSWSPDGSLYVGDWLNGRIRKIKNGVVSTVISGLSFVDQVNVADGGTNLLVVANGSPALSKYTGTGTLLWSIPGNNGFEDGPIATAKFGSAFGTPLGLANGDVLVTDPGNWRIRLISTAAETGITISPAASTFTESVSISIANSLGGVLRYTVDGSEPKTNSTLYTGAFTRTNQTTVKARVFVNNYPVSAVAVKTFNRIYVFPGDGITDAWRLQYFGAGFLTDSRAAANADPDNDGVSNLMEFQGGSDPLNALSGFAVSIRFAPVISWNSIPGYKYRIWRKESVASTERVVVVESFTATSAFSSHVDLTTTNQNSFYIVESIP